MGPQDFENHILAKAIWGSVSLNHSHVTIDAVIITKGMPCSRSYASFKMLQLNSKFFIVNKIDQSNRATKKTLLLSTILVG